MPRWPGSGSASWSACPPPPPRAPPPSQRLPEPASPSRPSPPSPSSVGVPALTDASVIREVQERLYNLNYDVGAINGRLTEETRNAIRQWQNNMQRPQKGDMDLEELTVLRNIRLPAIWGAIAFGDRGASAVVWNRGSRQDAVSAARSDCRGRNKGVECKVLSAADTACGALGFYMAGGCLGRLRHHTPDAGTGDGGGAGPVPRAGAAARRVRRAHHLLRRRQPPAVGSRGRSGDGDTAGDASLRRTLAGAAVGCGARLPACCSAGSTRCRGPGSTTWRRA